MGIYVTFSAPDIACGTDVQVNDMRNVPDCLLMSDIITYGHPEISAFIFLKKSAQKWRDVISVGTFILIAR